MTFRPLTLLLLEDRIGICRLGPEAALPSWALITGFVSITRTANELSVVCLESQVPEGIRCERGWRCLGVAGVLPFSAVGVLASLTAPLAEARVSVFAVSTFDTDYSFVKEEDWTKACEAAAKRRAFDPKWPVAATGRSALTARKKKRATCRGEQVAVWGSLVGFVAGWGHGARARAVVAASGGGTISLQQSTGPSR